MFEKLARTILLRRRMVVALFLLSIVLVGALGGAAISRLQGGGYSDPNSESAEAGKYLSKTFHVNDPAVTIIVKSTTQVNDPSVISAAQKLERAIAAEAGVARTLSYWSAGNTPTLISKDGKAAFLFVYSTNPDPLGNKSLGKLMSAKYSGTFQNLKLYAAGVAVFSNTLNEKISKDLALAESISIPLTFILLIFVFGGLISSAMPLIVGVSAILGALAAIFIISLFTDVSIFALNLITGMGLGLGIDYALLMVNRFREELHHGKDIDTAIMTTVATAGKTVFYSGITVIITLASLTFFPQMFLKSFGYAGITVVAMAILAALLPFPAILALLGHRINKFTVRKGALVPKSDGRWSQTARFVMRRPVAVVILSLTVITIIASPIRNIAFSEADSRVLPATSPLAMAYAEIVREFPGQEGNPIQIIVPNGVKDLPALQSYAKAIAQVPGIVRVNPFEIQGSFVRITAIHSMGSRTNAAQTMINEIRALASPKGTLVGGVAADYTDSQSGIARTLPWALGWIALGVLVLLFLFTGSIILPIKAVLLNLLSLTAMLGALSWIFVAGHLTWLVGTFTNTGTVDTSMAILISVVTFGLSMDYEVFLLSRIKEEHDAGMNNVDAVATGLQRSARIITAAAALLAVVFAIFVTSGVTNIKTLGFGVAFAILLDATLIRGLLVPALMRLFGERNWWAPEWMKRFTVSH